MIKIHIETNSGKEDYIEYPDGVDYNFDANNNWVGIFDKKGGLISSVAIRNIVRIESLENPINVTENPIAEKQI